MQSFRIKDNVVRSGGSRVVVEQMTILKKVDIRRAMNPHVFAYAFASVFCSRIWNIRGTCKLTDNLKWCARARAFESTKPYEHAPTSTQAYSRGLVPSVPIRLVSSSLVPSRPVNGDDDVANDTHVKNVYSVSRYVRAYYTAITDP